jgi:hypothetical protein
MADLQQTRTPDAEGIDAVGRLFVAFAIAITAIAAVIAYEGNVREFGSSKSTTEGRGTQ